MKQPTANRHCRILLAPLFALGFVVSASAQDERSAPTTPQATSSGEVPVLRTGKERLGGKWTDEQRVDNCNVPVDKRGTKPRPSDCAHVTTNTERHGRVGA